MGLTSPRLYRYRLRLASPLVLPGHVLHVREGLLLGSPDTSPQRWGDASPLPGWSSETLEEVVKAALAGDWFRYPSLEFAYWSFHEGASVLGTATNAPLSVAINGLLQGQPASLLKQAEEARDLGFCAVKVKVGRGLGIAEEVELLREVSDRLSPAQTLRLDANRAWSLEDAIRFAEAVKSRGLHVEYIEEPTRNPDELEAWHRATGLPYALDETLRETVSLSDFPNASTLVLKPTLMRWKATEQALRSGRCLVFSSCYESGVGIVQLARLAATFACGVAAGLDTYRCLADDVVTPRPRCTAGELRMEASMQVALEHCREIKT